METKLVPIQNELNLPPKQLSIITQREKKKRPNIFILFDIKTNKYAWILDNYEIDQFFSNSCLNFYVNLSKTKVLFIKKDNHYINAFNLISEEKSIPKYDKIVPFGYSKAEIEEKVQWLETQMLEFYKKGKWMSNLNPISNVKCKHMYFINYLQNPLSPEEKLKEISSSKSTEEHLPQI